MTETKPIDAGKLNRYYDEYAVELLKAYFDSGNFTGGQFEWFAGGGDNPETADRFTSDDIVAVSLLGMRIPGRAAIEILETRATELNALLSEIPNGVDLWDAPEATVGPDSAAERLWRQLMELPGVTAFMAGNLLARKRPRLIPVYDRVVKATLERNDGNDWWRALRHLLAGRPPLVKLTEELRDQSELGDSVSILRIIHVCLWMREFGRPESVQDSES